jgi:hypothetical protein
VHRISPRDLLLIISGRVAVKMLLTEATLDLLGEKLTCRSATNLIYCSQSKRGLELRRAASAHRRGPWALNLKRGRDQGDRGLRQTTVCA